MTADRSARIALKGALDIYRAAEVEEALPLDVDDIDRVVIDCSAVSSIDSSIITVFMRYRRKFLAAGKDPLNIVFIVSEPVRRLFEIAGISKSMTVISSSKKE